jgi:hypothetical protein
MDAETRHQLKQNEFAEALSRLRDFTDARFWYCVIVIVIVAGGWAGYRLWRKQQATMLESNWNQLLGIRMMDPGAVGESVNQLNALITDNSDPKLVAAARLRLGNALTLQALSDPVRRESLLREAVEVYAAIANAPDAPDSIAAGATYALGTAHESLREFDEARRTYEALGTEERFAETPFKEMAAQRLETLDELTVKVEFMPGQAPPPQPVVPEIGPEVGPPTSAAAAETQAALPAPASQPTSAESPGESTKAGAESGTPREAAQSPSSQPADMQQP